MYGRHVSRGVIFIDELRERKTEVTTLATEMLNNKENNFNIICNSGEGEYDPRIKTLASNCMSLHYFFTCRIAKLCNVLAACYIEFEGEKITFNQTDIKMTNGVLHMINEVIYTDNEVREQALLTACASCQRLSLLSFLVIACVLLLHSV